MSEVGVCIGRGALDERGTPKRPDQSSALKRINFENMLHRARELYLQGQVMERFVFLCVVHCTALRNFQKN